MRSKILATTPLFVVANLKRSLEFYCLKLGFGEPGVWGDPPCFGMINRDLFDLMLSVAKKPEHIRPNGVHGTWDMYIKVADLAAEIAALRAAGVAFEHRPEKTEYDMIELEVVDPDGYRICFGQDVVEE
jgi:catechol 2,3-dioxygenase-like lactoylglutathione lyase family enzyme